MLLRFERPGVVRLFRVSEEADMVDIVPATVEFVAGRGRGGVVVLEEKSSKFIVINGGGLEVGKDGGRFKVAEDGGGDNFKEGVNFVGGVGVGNEIVVAGAVAVAVGGADVNVVGSNATDGRLIWAGCSSFASSSSSSSSGSLG